MSFTRILAASCLAAIPSLSLAQTATTPDIAMTNYIPIIFLLVAAGVVVVGGLVLRSSIRARWDAKAAEAWPTAPGTITASEVAMRHIRRNKRRETRYAPFVSYRYSVGGAAYEGDRVSFGGQETSFRSSAEKIVAKYPVGASVSVRYDPSAPATATLESVARASTASMVLAAFFVLIGLVVSAVGAVLLLSSW